MTASLSGQPSSFEGYLFFQRLIQDSSALATPWLVGLTGVEFRLPPAPVRPRVLSVNTTGLTLPAEGLPESHPMPVYQPRTELGRRLMELRAQIVTSGEHLLDWDDVSREVAERRGGARIDNHAETGVR